MAKTAFELLQNSKEKIRSNVCSGIPTLDATILWEQSSIHLVAIKSYIGQIAFACQVARETIKNSSGLVYFASLEMTQKGIAQKIVSNELNEAQLSRIIVDDEVNLDALLEIDESQIELFILDYFGSLQLTENTFNNSSSFCRNAEIMQKIRNFAVQKKCAVLLISEMDPKITLENTYQSSTPHSSKFFRYVDSCTYIFEKFSMEKARVLTFTKNENVKVPELILDFDEENCIFHELTSLLRS